MKFHFFSSGDPNQIPMALYNGELISGFPTGNLSLQLLSKVPSDSVRLVKKKRKSFVFSIFEWISIEKNSFNNFADAVNGVKRGEFWGIVAIRPNFSQALVQK